MLKVFIVRVAAGLAVLSGACPGQVATPTRPPLSFEVASIRPVGPLDTMAFLSGRRPGISVDKARVYSGSTSVMELLCLAYDVGRGRVVGGPAWLYAPNVERFEIVAKMPEGATKEQVPGMLQALLAERFKVVAHHEKRDTSVYALIVGRGGPRLKDAVPDPPDSPSAGEGHEAPPGNHSATGQTASSAPAPNAAGKSGSGDYRRMEALKANGVVFNGEGIRMVSREDGQVRYEYDSVTMEEFAGLLSKNLDRPVVDQTRLKGRYQASYEINLMAIAKQALMSLAVSADLASKSASASDADDPKDSIVSSLKQLGLKLDTRVLPIDVLVIDHIEKTPTEN